jgi:prepilin-type N-terminal cleavage/methylation domain-containing protein
MRMNNLTDKAGFTLIEMSIVLLIIALIVGGILLGEDIVEQGKIRAAITQIQRYNTAVQIFQEKYGALPGDLDAATASSYALTSRSGAAGHGNANGLLEGCITDPDPTYAGCELLLFWRDLSDAKLIQESFSTATDAVTAIAAGSQSLYFPLAKLGDKSTYWVAFSKNGVNYWQLGGIVSTDGNGYFTIAYTLTPTEAFQLDNKMDDGMPQTGIVRAASDSGSGGFSALGNSLDPGATVCVAGSGNYNLNSGTYADSFLCQLRINFP